MCLKTTYFCHRCNKPWVNCVKCEAWRWRVISQCTNLTSIMPNGQYGLPTDFNVKEHWHRNVCCDICFSDMPSLEVNVETINEEGEIRRQAKNQRNRIARCLSQSNERVRGQLRESIGAYLSATPDLQPSTSTSTLPPIGELAQGTGEGEQHRQSPPSVPWRTYGGLEQYVSNPNRQLPGASSQAAQGGDIVDNGHGNDRQVQRGSQQATSKGRGTGNGSRGGRGSRGTTGRA